MTAGRKPVPVELKVLRGNPGKRPIPDNTPRPRSEKPRCPRYLKGEARKEWRRITKEFQALGVLARVDRAALEMYCQMYARWRQSEGMIDTHGLTVESPNGFLMQSPYVSIANKCLAEMKKLLTEFGGTPSSRVRVRVERPKEELTLADKLMEAVSGN